MKTLRLTLWDEDDRKLVGFRDLRSIRQRLEAKLSPGQKVEATKPEVVPVTWR